MPSESRRVFVTGGTGFLARAIYAANRDERWGWAFTCFSRSDDKQKALQARYPEVRTIRGDVAQQAQEYLIAAMQGHDTVIHTAANKYVDRSEFAALDTVRINIMGSLNVLEAAAAAGVETVVMISTDKAAAPVNIYGASKFVMERMAQDYATVSTYGGPKIVGVRYGNVVGSTGSIVPVMKARVAAGLKVEITDPEMTRFWMSARDAVGIIQHAMYDAQPGSIVIPANTKAMTIMQVAHAAVGAENIGEIVGARAGEKKHETLLLESEGPRAIWHPDWVELRPPGETPNAGEPAYTTIESDKPPGGFMSAAEMAGLIADAEAI